MKHLLSLCCALFLTFMLSAQSPAEEVDKVFVQSLKYAESLDYDKISSDVCDKRQAGFMVNGQFYKLYANLITTMKKDAQGIKGQKITIKEKNITALSESLVLLTAHGVAEARLDDGRVFNVGFLWSFVYEKTDKGWKVIHSHQSRANE